MSLLLWLFLALTANALPCPIARGVSFCKGDCASSAEADFARYSESELACGVRKEAAPYILKASGKAKGTVVLVHGLMANPTHMRQIAEEMQKEGYNVVAPILKGHGGSDRYLAEANLDEWKADVKFAGSVANKMDQPLYLMGHSTGGVMAGLEGSLRPGMYKAIVGWDPALNLEGPDGLGVRKACIAKRVPGWTYPSDLPAALRGPPSDDKAKCIAENHHAEQIRRAKEIEDVIEKFCGEKKTIPMNYEASLSALCALSQATDEMTMDRMRKLPPALALLSEDKAMFGYVSRPKLETAVAEAREGNEVVNSASPDHKLMPTTCAEGFQSDMARAKAWLQKNR